MTSPAGDLWSAGQPAAEGRWRGLPSSPLRAAYTRPPPALFLGGEIDEATYGDLRRVLDMVTATKRHLRQVDMAEVVYCDPPGLRAIVRLARTGSPGPGSVDQLVLRHLPAHLRTVISILGWDATPRLHLAEPVF